MDLETVDLHIVDSVAHVVMNRAEKRNAFNSQMVKDLTSAFESLWDHSCRSIILTGSGKAFSAGADLEYMSEMKNASRDENIEDARRLANLMELIYTHPKPVIAHVNGPAMGGGVGLISACDIAVAKSGSFFAFSEVRLGLVPAVISPYVVKKIGEANARFFMLTGDRFNSEKALEIGLVHAVALPVDIEGILRGITTSFALGGPDAIATCKGLIRRVGEEPIDEVKEYTSEMIADLRSGDEGQEGMASFLEKRDPEWQKI